MVFEVTTVNADGEERNFKFPSLREFFEDWYHDYSKGPGGDDEVLCYSFDGLSQDTHNIKENEDGYGDFVSLVGVLKLDLVGEILDELGYVHYDWHKYEDRDEWYGIVEFWTDTADQDVPTEFEFDGTASDFVKKFCEAAENYDVDEEVELYVDMRGKNGVPSTVRELLDDMQEAKDTLMEIAEKLQTAIN